MSRTIKDKPGYLKDIKRNEEELSRSYIREKNRTSKNNLHRMYHSHMDHCLDCGRICKNHDGTCDQCADESIEDLVTIYENANVA